MDAADSKTVTSKDGTRLAYERTGTGPAVILVNGALAYRASFGHGPLAALLAGHFTVYIYDRRGRGESSDAAWESRSSLVREREIEDLQALLEEAGGSASLYGDSSGGALVLEAALSLGDKVRKIALYEVPYNDDPAYRRSWRDYIRQLNALVAANRRGDAVALFMKLVGAPEEGIEEMRQSAMWSQFEAVGHTLVYDHTALFGEDASVPAERVARLTVPALVMNGGESFPFMRETAVALAKAIPGAQLRTLAGQTHEVAPEAVAPVLIEFFSSHD